MVPTGSEVQIKCPNCHADVAIIFGYAKYGRKGRCPSCKRWVTARQEGVITTRPELIKRRASKQERRIASGSYRDGPKFQQEAKHVSDGATVQTQIGSHAEAGGV